ncbi:MAG: glycosyltransferase family 9 protein [Nitrospirae bacterium]|nr:glycosyltransferase family 9 protein [Nitrospirota bacterium]
MKFNYLNIDVGNALKDCKNIAIIKFAYIGDSVWMLPFIKNLKKNLPHTKLTVIVNAGTEAFFTLSPYIDNIITFDRKTIKGLRSNLKFIKSIRDIKADAVFELTDTDRPTILSYLSGAKYIIGYNNENRWRNRLYTHISSSLKFQSHFVQYHLNLLQELGFEIFDTSLDVKLNPDCYITLKEKIPQLFDINNKKPIIIHPGSRNILRQWGTERFAKLCDLLYGSSTVILTAGPNETHLLTEIASSITTPQPIIAGSLTLHEFAALCKSSDLFIGNDSGPIHIAAAQNINVAGIYGPTMPQHVGPWTNKKIIIENNEMTCRPCYYERCKIDDYKKCLYSITPQEVYDKIL